MHNLFLGLFLIIFSANEAKISGNIYDKTTYESLAGVQVIAEGDTTYTDFDGHFEISNPHDSTKFSASLISYNKSDTIAVTQYRLTSNMK